MSIDRIIQQVQRQAQLLASEWQEEQQQGMIQSQQKQAIISFDKPTSRRWLHRDHLYIEPDQQRFLAEAYQQILGRTLDETGAQYYGQQLAQGVPRVFIVLALLRSPETKLEAHLGGMLCPRMLWLGYKLLSKLPPLAVITSKLLRLLQRWESERIAFWQPLAYYEEKLAAQLALHQQQNQQQLATLIQQITTSQVMVHGVEQNFHLLQHKLNYHQHALERLIDELAQPSHQVASVPTMQAHTQDRLDAYYVAFEDFNRGTREQIRHKLSPYLNIVQQRGQIDSRLSRLPLLDIGCGRGEWLQLLREHHLLATGVDMNPVMVDTCQQTGLDVRHSNALTWLRAQADNSHAAITGFHIIEHLPFEVLFDLFAESYRVLAPNGIMIFETPNPENLLVASHTFYHDFTHKNPITPTAISFLAKYHNFTEIDILRLHPYPSEARVAGHDALTERVNGHLTGPQDFAILAIKPARDEQRVGV
jgi:O-antigen chain-terminating methyltransferase